MDHYLQLFKKIIHGDLNPKTGSEFQRLNAAGKLQELYEDYKELFIVTFKEEKPEVFELLSQTSYAFADRCCLPAPNDDNIEYE